MERIYALLLAEILNFQGSVHLIGVGSLNKVKNIFPKDLDPVLMVFENVIFNAHMDYVHSDKEGDQL